MAVLLVCWIAMQLGTMAEWVESGWMYLVAAVVIAAAISKK